MRPKTLSASSIRNWLDCPAKFVGANLEYVPEVGAKKAANVGTAVHYALEIFVYMVYIAGTAKWEDRELLLKLYYEGYKRTFHDTSRQTEEYKDGRTLVLRWYKRTNLDGWTVLSVEQKKRYTIQKFNIPFTYIFDRIQWRIDEHGRRILKVVDYKSIRQYYGFDELLHNLQMRFYGLMAAIEFKDYQPDEIWVELDLLRHEPVGIQILREDNEETWEFLLELIELILNTPEKDAPMRLGPGCRFCPVSASCSALKKHRGAGGVMGLDTEQAMALYRELSGQQEGIAVLLEQIEGLVTAEMRERNTLSLSNSGGVAELGGRSNRFISDPARAAQIIGPELMSRYGSLKISDVDKLMDGEMLDPNQKVALQALIHRKPGRQTLKIIEPPSIGGSQ